MRKLISIIFILLYLTCLFRALVPYINYAINKAYIAEFLCINKDKPEMQCEGTCHLKKEIKRVSEEEKEQTSILQLKEIVAFLATTAIFSKKEKIEETKTTVIVKNDNAFDQFLAQPPTAPPQYFIL